jgi:hypothetical protein
MNRSAGIARFPDSDVPSVALGAAAGYGMT